MKRYERWLATEHGLETIYFDYVSRKGALEKQLSELAKQMRSSPKKFAVAEPTDFVLEKRLTGICQKLDIQCEYLATPQFLNSQAENQEYRMGKKRWFMGDFYQFQRRRLNVLMNGDQPVGDKWSFDEDNRKKVPKKRLQEIPEQLELERDGFDREAIAYTEKNFPGNPGSLEKLYYPSSHADAQKWLKEFLTFRLTDFGPYEDAIVEGESWLWHSVLTPALNVGLLNPEEVVKQTLRFAETHEIPINSLEGFIRQIIGWREFVRATYQDHGVEMRTTNHWQHHRKIPSSFYDGTTGIRPVDDTIQRVLKTGYCHHIERLMVLGGFMFLCEFDPDEIYRWFMEMFVDSYDWVMVPNAYSMSQHADGGLITTKPYFSGSSYIRKMSHHSIAPWCETWDGLYWRWIWNHHDQLSKNPRWAMMCSMAKKMDETKRKTHLANAQKFLDSL